MKGKIRATDTFSHMFITNNLVSVWLFERSQNTNSKVGSMSNEVNLEILDEWC